MGFRFRCRRTRWSSNRLYRLIESGELHFIDTRGEGLLICSGSFL